MVFWTPVQRVDAIGIFNHCIFNPLSEGHTGNGHAVGIQQASLGDLAEDRTDAASGINIFNMPVTGR
jgi:hypothetical protein